ncbi:hypothetical protein JX265_012412 [Neoarthrinium moseri]|uniref:Cytochrome b5 heme-binding domain-containing protein n=1 Tax=Neoarthrinium moseri TaxID=1658444 RepID=A0A9P9WAX1_9PEZI|nr:hypothetical protein JX266_002968 [Neoarthrinium moseri]KAI1855057.1 hypothetical protein JX265_012412 [Neoarthrinium moseri]
MTGQDVDMSGTHGARRSQPNAGQGQPAVTINNGPLLSPYAQHFFPSDVPSWRNWYGQLHSEFAPMYPYLNLSNLSAMPPPSPQTLPSNAELDILFVQERMQQSWLFGLKTWQVAPLQMLPDGFSASTPLPSLPPDSGDAGWARYEAGLIEVDETSWFSFFKRDRWFDVRENCLVDIQDPFPAMYNHATNWWTVDNDEIWRHLRLPIEMANRTLLHLFNEPRPNWIERLLFGARLDWSVISAALREELKKNPNTRNPPVLMHDGFTRPRNMLLQQMEAFNKNTIWSFMEENTSAEGLGAWGFTLTMDISLPLGQIEATRFQTILVHAGFIRGLCDRTTTLPERANLHFNLTVTILHELMHATFMQRQWLERFVIPLNNYDEPHINKEPFQEVGWSYELHMLGGKLQIAPQPAKGMPSERMEKFRGGNMHLMLQEWPDYLAHSNLPTVLQYGDTTPVTFNFPLPVAYSSAFSNAYFWDYVVDKHGSKAFKAPKILRCEVTSPWFSMGVRHYAARRTRIPHDTPESFKDSYRQVLSVWSTRRAAWENHRPWYAWQYFLWGMSPWSWTRGREYIELFRAAHARRDYTACLIQVGALTKYRQWSDYFEQGNEGNPVIWLFISIGYLMLATLPPRSWSQLVLPDPQKRTLKMYPTSRATPPFLPGAVIDLSEVRPDLDALDLADWRRTRTVTADPVIFPADPIARFEELFMVNAQVYKVPTAWLKMILTSYKIIKSGYIHRASLGASQASRTWLDFPFQIPLYDTDWGYGQLWLNQTGSILQMDIASGVLPPDNDIGRLLSPQRSPVHRPLQDLPSATGPPTVRVTGRRTAMNKQDEFTDYDPSLPRYYTISQVGNHIDSDNSTWVIESDGDCSYDVYRITKMCRKLGYTTARRIRSRLLEVGPLGPMLRTDGDEHANKIRCEFGKSIFPLGKLVVHRRPEDIAEYDGTNGMPVWIRIGANVYDLTDFKLPRKDQAVMDALKKNPGGHPPNIPKYPDLWEKLRQHRCALVMEYHRQPQDVLHPFTEKMLRYHDNPTYGCYTAIDGYVYDIGNYLENHPGGDTILIKYLGQEATEFTDWHDVELMDNYPELRIGRIVPEIHLDQLQKHQVALCGWVFDISGLDPEHNDQDAHTWIHANVKQFGGAAADEALGDTQSERAAALMQLHLYEKDLIVGKVRHDESLPSIPIGELRKYNDPKGVNGAWTVVDGLVYDVTALMLHGPPFFEYEVPGAWAGTNLNDDNLAYWLAEKHPYRAIGRLVEGPAWELPIVPNSEKKPDPVTPDWNTFFGSNTSVPAKIVQWAKETNPTREAFSEKLAKHYLDQGPPALDRANGRTEVLTLPDAVEWGAGK